MAAPPFKVKALFAYDSPHDDDLSFPANQIITVIEVEDADWYVGEYIDASGEQQSGLFPNNFVEKYEPTAPPRPVRAAKTKPAEAPLAQDEAPPAPREPTRSEESTASEPSSASESRAVPPVIESASKPPPQTSQAPAASQAPPPSAPKPTPSQAKSPPPPVAEKSSSFRDRIAAFNKPAAAPVAPFKPSGASTTFIKKPFVAPPPSRDAYVPVAREAPVAKVYRREEDPEIAERERQDQENAEKAGLVPTEGQEEDQPKPVSLKERIALLQKQQAEQAARQSGHSHTDVDKPKRAPKPRPDLAENEERARDSIDTDRGDALRSSSVGEHMAEPVARHVPRAPVPVPEREVISDGNEADQSAAGEMTEGADDDEDTSVEGDHARQTHPQAPVEQTDVGDEEDEEGEEDEVDEETRRQMAIRERMAKLSGGMGMPGMFGAMPMPGMGGPPPPRKRAPERRETEDSEASIVTPAPRVPMVPIPGMSGSARPPPPSRPEVTKEADDEDEPISSQYEPEEVPDMEELHISAAVRTQRAVPPPPPHRDVEQPSERGAPAVPGSRPVPEAPRAVPPPPDLLASDSEGSESGDEMPEAQSPQPLPIRTVPPPMPSRDIPPRTSIDTPRSPPLPPVRQSLDGSRDAPGRAPSKRESRAVPPIPFGSPGGGRARSPPPPPPNRTATSESLKRRTAGLGLATESGSEYEGDYDTDIASGDKHKDALKAHGREPSFDDSIMTDDVASPLTSRPPPLPPTSNPRGAPSLPPLQPSMGRPSGEMTRAPPPPPPAALPSMLDVDDDYDPYRYGASAQANAAPSGARPMPGMPPPPPRGALMMTQPGGQDSGPEDYDSSDVEEEQQYAAPRMSSDRAPPPMPPQDRMAPPPPNAAPSAAPMPNNARRSTDIDRALGGRQSMEQGRPSMDQGFAARDIDMALSSRWWTQTNMPPPAVQGRPDVLYEMEESTASKRGGKTTVTKDIYILYQDYSQTTLNVQFDAKNPDDVHFDQSHKPPPAKLQQDQLENAHTQFGAKIAAEAAKQTNNTVGDGTPYALIHTLLSAHPTSLPPIGNRAYGTLIYANLANASTISHDEIRPGDIVTFRNAKFQGKHGPMHAKYSLDVGKPDHVAVVAEWDGTKKKIKAWEQGREKGKGKVKVESFKVGDLRSGEVRVWRVMGRGWVGWDG